jgi:hypothetical protein
MLSIAILTAFLIALVPKANGKNGKENGYCKKVDLKTHDIGGQGTHQIIITKSSSGDLYVVWRAEANKNIKNAAKTGKIPGKFMKGSWKKGWNSVVGLSIYKGSKWLTPNILVDEDVQCAPEFAWCDGDNLNLIVNMPNDTLHHLEYEPKSKEWALVQVLDNSSQYCAVYKGICVHKDAIHMVGFSRKALYYICFDGKKWNKSLAICDDVKFDGMYGFYSPRISVTDEGAVHVVWSARGTPMHTIIKDGKFTKPKRIPTKYLIHANAVDITAYAKNKLLIAYQGESKKGANPNAVYVMEYDGKNWTGHTALASDSGLNLGSPQLVSHGSSILLAWWHRDSYSSGSYYVSGPVVSFMVRGVDGTWSKRKPTVGLKEEISHLDMPGAFYTIYADTEGFVHMAWGSHTDNYYVLVTRLPKNTKSKDDKTVGKNKDD